MKTGKLVPITDADRKLLVKLYAKDTELASKLGISWGSVSRIVEGEARRWREGVRDAMHKGRPKPEDYMPRGTPKYLLEPFEVVHSNSSGLQSIYDIAKQLPESLAKDMLLREVAFYMVENQ